MGRILKSIILLMFIGSCTDTNTGGNFDSSYDQIGASIEANQQVRVSYLKSSGEKAKNCKAMKQWKDEI